MSSTPLLNRQQEGEVARRIERTRRFARRAMLATDYVLQLVANLLERVAAGRVRVETVCEGSISSDEHRRRLAALIAANVATLNDLLRRNRAGFPPSCRRGGRWPSDASFAGSTWPAGPRPSAWSRRRPSGGSTFKRCWTSLRESPGGWRPPWRSWPSCAAANGPTPTPCRGRKPTLPPASARGRFRPGWPKSEKNFGN